MSSHSGQGAHVSLFEGLFRAVPPDEATLAALGGPPDPSQPWHPSTTWALAVRLTRERRYPELSVEEGDRALGRDFSDAFAHTLAGAVLSATLPLLSPAAVFRHWPRFVAMGRNDVELEVTRPDSHVARVASRDPVALSAGFSLGLFDYVFGRLGLPVRYRVEATGPGAFVVECDWGPDAAG